MTTENAKFKIALEPQFIKTKNSRDMNEGEPLAKSKFSTPPGRFLCFMKKYYASVPLPPSHLQKIWLRVW